MKRNIWSFVFFLLIGQFVHAQQDTLGRVVYQLDGSASAQTSIQMYFSKSRYRYSNSKSDFEIFLDKKKGSYKSLKDSLDDVERLAEEKKNDNRLTSHYGELGSPVITHSSYNRNTNKVYCVNDTLQSFMQWELQSDTMTVRGILCQKVIGTYNGNKYVAWFAPSIPVSAGIMFYRGLPGLLIQSTNIDKRTTFGIIDLEWPSKQKIALTRCNDGGVYMTNKELIESINKQNERADKINAALEKAKKEGKQLNIKDLLKDN